MSSKYKNKCGEIQENLSIESIYKYVFLSYYISNAKHIHSISGGRVTWAKCLHGKIFIWSRRYPASFCRELVKPSFSVASCKQSPGITISFYNSRELALPGNSPPYKQALRPKITTHFVKSNLLKLVTVIGDIFMF